MNVGLARTLPAKGLGTEINQESITAMQWLLSGRLTLSEVMWIFPQCWSGKGRQEGRQRRMSPRRNERPKSNRKSAAASRQASPLPPESETSPRHFEGICSLIKGFQCPTDPSSGKHIKSLPSHSRIPSTRP